MNTKFALVPFLLVASLAMAFHAGAEPVQQVLPFEIRTTLIPQRTYSVRFSLFDAGMIGTGNELWREVRSYKIPPSRDINHELGSVVPFLEGMHGVDPSVDPVPVDFTRQLWVEIQAAGFLRRVKLAAVPFAIATSGLRVVPYEANPALSRDNSIVIGADMDNQATGRQSIVLGGGGNHASGEVSTIAGGCSNATGPNAYASFAAGEEANASKRATFVWSAADDIGLDGIPYTLDDRIFEEDGFPQTVDKDGVPNPLLRDTQFWVKAPGGVFFVTGKDEAGAPEGLMLRPGSGEWESINAAYHEGVAAADSRTGGAVSAGAAPSPFQTLQATVRDLDRRLAAQQEELAASRAESAALRARLEEIALRQAELRRLLAGEPRNGGEVAASRGEGIVLP